VIGRQDSQRRAGRCVTPVPGLCEAAFVLEISPKKANVVAAKGIWQVETEVIVGGKQMRRQRRNSPEWRAHGCHKSPRGRV
jgi:hypothetical protein